MRDKNFYVKEFIKKYPCKDADLKYLYNKYIMFVHEKETGFGIRIELVTLQEFAEFFVVQTNRKSTWVVTAK